MKRQQLKVLTANAKLGASTAATNQRMSSRMATDATFLAYPGVVPSPL